MNGHRVSLFLIAANLLGAILCLIGRLWALALVGALGAWVVAQGIRIDRLEDEIDMLRGRHRLFDHQDTGGDGT